MPTYRRTEVFSANADISEMVVIHHNISDNTATISIEGQKVKQNIQVKFTRKEIDELQKAIHDVYWSMEDDGSEEDLKAFVELEKQMHIPKQEEPAMTPICQEQTYTIEDLRLGKVAVEYDGTFIDDLNKVLSVAFPRSTRQADGTCIYYYLHEMANEWGASDGILTGVPIQSVKEFLKQC